METATSIQPTTTNINFNQDIQELTISLVIKNFNPTLLSYEFLTMSGIIPNTWELARQPVVNARASQVGFKNGVNIVAQGNTLSFVEGLGSGKKISDLQFDKIALQYVDRMPQSEYQGLSIAPKIIIPFPGEEGGKDFINNNFLNGGTWRNIGNQTPQSSLSLFYNLDKCNLSLNINPAKLQQPNNVSISAVLFAGSFNYLLAEMNIGEVANILKNLMGNWQDDFNTFQGLVYQQFLQKAPPQQESLFDN